MLSSFTLLTEKPTVAVQDPATGRWFITIGHAGFNSPANNRNGYATAEAALAAHYRYAGKREG